MTLCGRCGKKLPDNYSKKTCPECLEKARKRNNFLYDTRRKQGLCYSCGNEINEYGYKICLRCRQRQKVYKIRYLRKVEKLNELHYSGSAPVSGNQKVV